MANRSKGDGEEVFGPHLGTIAEIIHEAVRDFYTTYGRDLHALEPWTQAGVIRDLIVKRLRAYCDSTPGLQPIRDGNASFFGFNSKFLAKVKRLGVGFHANVGPTQAALKFDSQEVPGFQGELVEQVEATTVYVGYVPTVNAPLSPPVYIVCKNSQRKVEWVIECKPPSPPPAVELRPDGPSPSPGEAAPRVKVKRKPGKTGKSGTDG